MNRLDKDIIEIVENNCVPWEKLRERTVLITGTGGFIAYYIVRALLTRNELYQDGIRVIGLVRDINRARAKYSGILEKHTEDFILYEADVCDQDGLERIAPDGVKVINSDPGYNAALEVNNRIDYIIHAASQASAWHFENDPVGTIRANLVGTDNILRLAKECDSEVLIISSLKVYGSVKDGSERLFEEKLGELDIDSYKSCYAMGKRAAETLAASYVSQYGLKVKIARPAYIFGAAGLDDDRVWAQFIKNIVKGEDILLKSSGAVSRSFCYVTDVVTAMLTVLLKGESIYPYNISCDKGNVTIREFAEKAARAFPDKNLKLRFANPGDEKKHLPDSANETPEILDASRLAGLGWEAKVDILEGIQRAAQILGA